MSENWPSTKVGDCCDILDNLRVPLNAEERTDIQGNIPYYGANGLQGYIDKFIFDEPLILLAEDGGYFDEYESRPIAYRIRGKSWVNNHAHILRTKVGGSFSQDFVFYCLEHKNLMPFIKGGTRAKLNQAELREIRIQKPPEPMQRRIAQILSTVDEAIEQTEALIAKYQQMKAGLMHDLFARGVTPDGHLRPTYAQAPHLYKESRLGWIPSEWEVCHLAKLCATPTRDFGSFSSTNLIRFLDSGVPFIKSEMIEAGKITWDGVMFISEEMHRLLNKSHVQQGNILFSKIGSALGKAVVYDGSRGVCNSNAAVAKIEVDRRKASAFFVMYFLNHETAQTQFKKMIVSLLPRINLGDINHLLVPVPPLIEQRMVEGRLLAFDKALSLEEQRLHKQTSLKHGLMLDLLTGRVRVKVAETASI